MSIHFFCFVLARKHHQLFGTKESLYLGCLFLLLQSARQKLKPSKADKDESLHATGNTPQPHGGGRTNLYIVSGYFSGYMRCYICMSMQILGARMPGTRTNSP